jgi:hypothetical protein
MRPVVFAYTVSSTIKAIYDGPNYTLNQGEHLLNRIIRHAVGIDGRVEISLNPDIDRRSIPKLELLSIKEPDATVLICET